MATTIATGTATAATRATSGPPLQALSRQHGAAQQPVRPVELQGKEAERYNNELKAGLGHGQSQNGTQPEQQEARPATGTRSGTGRRRYRSRLAKTRATARLA